MIWYSAICDSCMLLFVDLLKTIYQRVLQYAQNLTANFLFLRCQNYWFSVNKLNLVELYFNDGKQNVKGTFSLHSNQQSMHLISSNYEVKDNPHVDNRGITWAFHQARNPRTSPFFFASRISPCLCLASAPIDLQNSVIT